MNIPLLEFYAIFLGLTFIFILFVLRACYYLINKADPLEAVKLHPQAWKSIKMDRQKKEIDRKIAMS